LLRGRDKTEPTLREVPGCFGKVSGMLRGLTEGVWEKCRRWANDIHGRAGASTEIFGARAGPKIPVYDLRFTLYDSRTWSNY
jgi:hypothetical protein